MAQSYIKVKCKPKICWFVHTTTSCQHANITSTITSCVFVCLFVCVSECKWVYKKTQLLKQKKQQQINKSKEKEIIEL